MKKSYFSHLMLSAMLTASASAFAAEGDVQPFTLPMSLRPTLAEFERFTTLNANNDTREWQFNEDENCIYYSYSSTKDADDWVFIPFELSAGDTYLKVSVEALASGVAQWYDENFELAIGGSATAASMRTILTKTVDQDTYTPYETTFSNDITGTAYLGIHATSPKGRRTLKMRNIVLQSYATPIPLTPQIKSSAMDGLDYKATVAMPSMSVQGNAIEGKVNLRFSVDGTETRTFTDLTPGSDVNVEATLTKGNHTITYVAYLTTDGTTTESEPVSEAVTAKDLNAQYALPFTFGPADAVEFGECKVVDGNCDDKTWTFSTEKDDPSFYYPYHSKNKANDWIILPAVNFGTTDKIRISVDARSKGSYTESFEVYLGRDASASAMTVMAIEVPEIKNSSSWTTYESTLDTEGGIWFVGIKASSPADAYGLYVRNVRIESLNDPQVGVEGIESEIDAEPEYFNLQGVRLAAPEKGQIVIVRKGGKTFKSIIR